MITESTATEATNGANTEATAEGKTFLSADEAKGSETFLTEASNKEGAQPKEEARPKKTAAEYKLELPDGSDIGQEHLDKIAAYAAEQGLSNEQAQDILNFKAEAVTDYLESTQKMINERRQEWLEELRSDPEFGGQNLSRTKADAGRVIQRFATRGLVEALNASGLGDHKELIITLAKIGRAMSDDSLVAGQLTVVPQTKSPADRLYGGG